VWHGWGKKRGGVNDWGKVLSKRGIREVSDKVGGCRRLGKREMGGFFPGQMAGRES